MIRRLCRPRACGLGAAAVAAFLVSGCSWLPSIPVPSLPSWLGGAAPKKLAPAPAVNNSVPVRLLWQTSLGGKPGAGFTPAVVGSTVYAASLDGTLGAWDGDTGAVRWRVSAGKRISAGPGAGEALVVVGTDKGEILAYDPSGKPLWQARVSSEVSSPPLIAEGLVMVWSGDGRIFGLSAENGSRRWVYQRSNPPLVIRRFAGGVVSRGALFSGTPGGKLVAVDTATGNVGWEANVATPKGATELERIADVSSLPVVEDRQVCAVAFQGRFACFEILRGTLNWSREVSSLAGTVGDGSNVYVTDDKGAIHALDRSTGASVWKQDKLGGRDPGGPQIIGRQVAVVDASGQLFVLAPADGAFVATVNSDGTPPVGTPVRMGEALVWVSEGGSLIAVGAR